MGTVDDKFDLDRAEDRVYLNELQNTYLSEVGTSDSEGNETDRVLSSQLILITTVIITGNIVVLGNKDLLQSLTWAQQGLVAIGLASLVASLYSGITYFQKIRAFHRGWGEARYNVVLELDKVKTGDKYSDLSAKVDNLIKHKGANIDEKYLNYEIWILFGALFVYLVLVVSLVGDWHFITGHWDWYK